ncbi:MAG: hypothetical protein OXU45_05645 [Candidatus Melainabacteria bacterium]|nr:hypothetical protein [Candidatus Melainabacteria bacterium]
MVASIQGALSGFERLIGTFKVTAPIGDQFEFINRARDRLSRYENNLKIAREFHQVDEPKLAQEFETIFTSLEEKLSTASAQDFRASLKRVLAEHAGEDWSRKLALLLLQTNDPAKTETILDSLEAEPFQLKFPENFKLTEWLIELNEGRLAGISSKQQDRVFALMSPTDAKRAFGRLLRNRTREGLKYDQVDIEEAKVFEKLVQTLLGENRFIAHLYAVIANRHKANPLLRGIISHYLTEDDSVVKQFPLEEVH